jgi:hypothetical protein
MSQDDRLIPHDIFQLYRRRRQPRDRSEPCSNDDVVKARTEILVKEMHLRGLERSRNKLLRRMEDLKRLRDRFRKGESDTST